LPELRILVSACLLGINTRYDGGHSRSPGALALAGRHELVPVCPEQLGGLPTPRPRCEIRDGRVLREDGMDMTEAFSRGAGQAMALCRDLGCQAALLKSKSPSCGSGHIHDGSFSGRLVRGDGVLAGLLKETGIPVYSEEQLEELE